MYNSRDFPDFMTAAAVIKDRHGPPPLTLGERTALDAASRKRAAQIVAAYDVGKSIRAIEAGSIGVGRYQIRQIIAKENFSRRFPDRHAMAAFGEELEHMLCERCRIAYFNGPWRRWVQGERLTFVAPQRCTHRQP